MICACIVSYNSDKVFRCFKSIETQVDFVVIVDNGTKNESLIEKLLTLENDKCKVILNDENLGIAKALNQGVAFAKSKNAKWILTLDNDSEVLPQTVSQLMDDYNKLDSKTQKKTAILALKYIDRNITVSLKCNTNETVGFKQVKYALTSGNFIKISALEKGGYFDEKLFIDQVDHDLNFRLRKNGFIILQSQKNYLLHELGQAEKKFGFTIKNYSPIRRYYLSRNCIYVLKKYLFFDPRSVLRIFVGVFGGGLFKITFFEKQKFLKYKYILEGIFDGLFNLYGKKYNP